MYLSSVHVIFNLLQYFIIVYYSKACHQWQQYIKKFPFLQMQQGANECVGCVLELYLSIPAAGLYRQTASLPHTHFSRINIL